MSGVSNNQGTLGLTVKGHCTPRSHVYLDCNSSAKLKTSMNGERNVRLLKYFILVHSNDMAKCGSNCKSKLKC